MNVYQIGNTDIKKIKYEDIMFVSLAESGAMGEPGEVTIILSSHGKTKICHANYCFGSFDIEQFSEVFAPLKTFDCGIFGKVSGVADGWHHVYMGMGNHLFVRDTVYPKFAAAIDEKEGTEVYRSYLKTAQTILETAKKEE